MAKRGPKQSERTTRALKFLDGGETVLRAAYRAGISPSTLYRALQRKEKKV